MTTSQAMAPPRRVAIMQPYLLPYIGYWQLMAHVDTFVVYDKIQYTKKGWINRNRFLSGGKPEIFSLPLKKDSDYIDISDRKLSSTHKKDFEKILRRFHIAYRKAPYFEEAKKVLEEIFFFPDINLFNFLLNSISVIRYYLNIDNILAVSSEVTVPHYLKGEDRVIAICQALEAEQYINPISGCNLYNAQTFAESNLKLSFLRPILPEYSQGLPVFEAGLSIIDVIAHLPPGDIRKMLTMAQIVDSSAISQS